MKIIDIRGFAAGAAGLALLAASAHAASLSVDFQATMVGTKTMRPRCFSAVRRSAMAEWICMRDQAA